MIKEWKRIWARRPRLSRGWKTARNLILCVPILVWFWGEAGYPLPTAGLEFRRMERTHLLPRSEIVYNSKRDDPIQWKNLPELSRYHGLIIGVMDKYVHVYEPDSNLFQCHLAGDGITPIPLYDFNSIWIRSVGTLVDSKTAILFLQVPEEADRAELEISGIGRYWEELRCQEEGWRLAPGLWLFTAEVANPGEDYRHWEGWCIGGDYTLTLYRADGSLLLEQSGTLPEE